jgi:hypothetical protein
MNAWDKAREMAEKHSGGNYVKLQNDGDKIVGAFVGEPHAREVYWDGKKYLDSKPEGGTAKASLRVSLNFFVPGEGMKIIEGNTSWFNDLLKVKDKYGLEKSVFEIVRSGSKGDPKTKYMFMYEKPVSDALQAEIAKAPLHDLTRAAESETGDGGAGDTPKTIDIDTAKAVIERLKALPPGEGQAFLAEFKLARIRDLLSADLPAAIRFIEAREAKNRPVPHQSIDPFAV